MKDRKEEEMKKLISYLTLIALAVTLTACSCPCGKKAQEKSQEPQTEQAPAE